MVIPLNVFLKIKYTALVATVTLWKVIVNSIFYQNPTVMKAFFTSVLTFSILVCFAQAPTTPQTFDPEQNLRALGNLNPLSAGAIGFDNRYQGVKGTPLLFPEWQWGTIQFAKQDTFSSTPFKVNVDLIKNTLIVQLRDGSLGEISAMNVKALQVKNDLGELTNWTVASEKEVEGMNSIRRKFYQSFYEGKLRLVKSTIKVFKKGNYQGAYSNGNTYDEFLTEEHYWLSVDGKRFEKIKIKRKDIENALSAQATAVTDLSKTHKLNLNEVKDVAKLLSLLETAEKK